MGNKIIVAGAGHGGIAAAHILAQRGFDVTVYEKNKRENLGYDWTDIFDKNGFTACGMDIPPRELYNLKHDMTFYGPSFKTPLRQHTPEDRLEIQIERRDLYDYMIAAAETKGVNFEFETFIEGPILFGNRVVGIKTDRGDIFADLVIDAAGINSPVRSKLPPLLGIQNHVKEYEQFYVYRGFYNKTAELDEDNFKVMLLYENKLGICWVATEEDHTDVLIGRFEPLNTQDVEQTLASLRKTNDTLGTELLRGGQFVNIPVRQPLGVLVANGYAAVGDSAFMTIPIIGSGIANSMTAGAILADAVSSDRDMSFSAETLWTYQKNFYKKIGGGLAPLACIKLLLTRISGDELNYIFDNGILNADDMTNGTTSASLAAIVEGMSIEDILKVKLKGLVHNKDVMKKVVRMGGDVARATAVTAAMPMKYDRTKVLQWVKCYNKCFSR